VPFAVKLQLCTGVSGHVGPDYRGGEPQDTHRTLKELDPVEDSEVETWLERASVVNEILSELTPEVANEFAHLEVRIMDSDGHP